MNVGELRAQRNGVDVALPQLVTPERADIADIDHCRFGQLPLDVEVEIVDGLQMPRCRQ